MNTKVELKKQRGNDIPLFDAVLCSSHRTAVVVGALSVLVLSIAYIFSAVNLSSFLSDKSLSSSSSSPEATAPTSSESDEMAEAGANNDAWKTATNIYGFTAPDINGEIVDLSKYRGRVVLIVNVACNCGFTGGNYPQLQELFKKHEADGLSVLAFPCNQFGGQEPRPEAEIKDFVKKFDVQFEMFSKINVNGDAAHPLYKFLKSKVDGTFGSFIKWNFSKFLIDRNGVPVKRYAPTTEPRSIEEDILKLLAGKTL